MAGARPETGGRVELELSSAGAEGVVYRVVLALPDADFAGEARVDAAGAVTVTCGEGAPGWMVEYAKAFLRAEWRGRQGGEAAPWPRRLTRWRAG